MNDSNDRGPAKLRIPLQRPCVTGDELTYVTRVIQSGKLGSDGFYTLACARLLEHRFGIGRVLMTPSCTAALELAVILCGVGPGDEVILPSYTFVSTANAVARVGARPVFVDIEAETLNIDTELIERSINPRTRAILPVHYRGVGCAMDAIMSLAQRHNLPVIEDAAQGVGGFVAGRALGSIGQLGAFSFHETKNLACGEGGALCVNDPALVERAEILREKGTNRSRFLRGEVDRYSWVDVGSSYLPSELACAFLLAQLEGMDAINQRRAELDRLYRLRLVGLEDRGLARLPHVPENGSPNHHTFHLILNDPATRDGLMDHLRARGIAAAFHFVPLHTSPMGMRLGYRAGDLPVTEDLSQRLLRLPFYTDLSEKELDEVVETVLDYFEVPSNRVPARKISDELAIPSR